MNMSIETIDYGKARKGQRLANKARSIMRQVWRGLRGFPPIEGEDVLAQAVACGLLSEKDAEYYTQIGFASGEDWWSRRVMRDVWLDIRRVRKGKAPRRINGSARG